MTFQYWLGSKQQQNKLAYKETGIVSKAKEAVRVEMADRALLPVEEDEILVETEKYLITFSTAGGAIKKIDLKEFADKETGEPYEMINIEDPKNYIGALSFSDGSIDEVVKYVISKNGNTINCEYESPEGLKVVKRYNIQNTNDYIELDIILGSTSGRDLKISYNMVVGSGINVSSIMSQRYHYASAKIDGIIVWLKKDSVKTGEISWLTLNNEYFCVLMRPYQIAKKVFVRLVKKGDILCGIETPLFVVPGGAENVQQYFLYVGPFNHKRIAELGMGIEDAVNYGKLNGIVVILLKILGLFHKVVRNWGVAIILMTTLVNVILFPLTRKSYKSMKAAQELQPQIDKLRSAHKDNPQKMNKEVMALYKQYKVNPLSGCLPMFLQFPIFFALYHVLIRSVELKGSNFLWIKDLSSPDALGLPFTLPFLGNSINILPIITAGVMFLQQKVMSAKKTDTVSEQMKQQQVMMMYMIPGMMLVFFYKMPSGFVLYFLVNSALMAYVQYKIKTSLK